MGESSQALYLPPGGRGTDAGRWKENAIELLCMFSRKIRAECDGVRLSENLTEYIPHRKLK